MELIYIYSLVFFGCAHKNLSFLCCFPSYQRSHSSSLLMRRTRYTNSKQIINQTLSDSLWLFYLFFPSLEIGEISHEKGECFVWDTGVLSNSLPKVQAPSPRTALASNLPWGVLGKHSLYIYICCEIRLASYAFWLVEISLILWSRDILYIPLKKKSIRSSLPPKKIIRERNSFSIRIQRKRSSNILQCCGTHWKPMRNCLKS